jgi:hypothetical protein
VIPRWTAPLLAIAGVAPVRVWALRDGLRAAARGQAAEQHAQRGGGGLHPDASRVVLLVFFALISVGLAVGVGMLRHMPDLAVTLLIVAQGGAVLMRTGTEVVPLVLGADDRRVLGWWPVSERELLVARGLIVLESVLEASAAILAIPLLVLLVTGRPPVVVGLGALVGTALHAVTLGAFMLLAVHGLGRLLGRQHARRVVDVLGSVVMIIVLNLALRAFRPLLEQIDALPAWLRLLAPAYWYGAWGAVASPGWLALLAVSLSVVATLALVVPGLRLLGRRGEVADADEPVATRRPRDWTGPLVGWLRPWLGGRDGRAMTLLLRAHLREDWRFTGALIFLPGAILAYLLLMKMDDVADLGRDLGNAASLATTLSLWMSFLALSLGGAITSSVSAPAAWLPHGGVVQGRRWLSLQRRAIRMLVPLPLLVVVTGVMVWRAGLDPRQAPLVVVPAWLTFEALVLFLQATAPTAPFSRAWRREGHEFKGFHLLLLLAWPLVTLPVVVGFRQPPWGVVAALAWQVLAVLLLRWLLSWRVGRHGVFGASPRP